MQLPIRINSKGELTLQRQLSDEIRRLIADSTLLPGTPMPSTRRLADQLKVARNTVVIAYDRLISEGYLEARAAQATYVCHRLPHHYNPVSAFQINAKPDHSKDIDRSAISEMALNLFSPQRERLSLDLRIGRPDRRLFPIAVWRRIILESLGGLQHTLFEYADPAGNLFLRKALRDYLRVSRGIKADIDQIIIVTGSQQGFGMTGRLLDISGNHIVVEDPCYRGAKYAFQYLGGKLSQAPVDRDGLRVDSLPLDGCRLVYVTPAHQFPLGHVMSATRRSELLEWAARTGTYILEDDYDSEYSYKVSPLAALQSMDTAERVIYLGTFSKTLGPNLRLGYLVVPRHLVRPAHATKAIMDNGHPWLEQVVVGEFIRSGSFESHTNKSRQKYAARHDLIIKLLSEKFEGSSFCGTDNGMHLTWITPDRVPPAFHFQQMAKAVSVGIYSLDESPAYKSDTFQGDAERMVFLGYPSLSETEIGEAVDRLASL